MGHYFKNLTVKSIVSFISLLMFVSFNSPLYAQTKDIKVMLDWIVQGSHAPFFVAQEKGFYTQNGLNVKIDAGKGATNTAINVASDVYQFGWVDMPTMIKFNAENPNTPLLAVYISFDETPLAVLTLKSKNIRTPADLDGKKIAGGPGTAVHDTISILMKAAGVPNTKINWLSVQPQLFGPMVKQGEADGTGGFTNSNIPALMDVGIAYEDIYPIKYSDFGADLYGIALVTTLKFSQDNPDIVKSMVSAFNKGTIETIKNPQDALKILKARDPLLKEDIEKVRLNIALGLTNTEWVKKNGLSVVQPARMTKMINAVADAYSLKSIPNADSIYTEKFLPPISERMIKQ
jgi:NitT/TauT family transport system substrate-binding protein